MLIRKTTAFPAGRKQRAKHTAFLIAGIVPLAILSLISVSVGTISEHSRWRDQKFSKGKSSNAFLACWLALLTVGCGTGTDAPEVAAQVGISQQEFDRAIDRLNAQSSIGTSTPADCSSEHLHLWPRPATLTPALWGNSCEPGMTRGAIELLNSIIVPGMTALQWTADTGSLWLLGLGLSKLTTIEHSPHRADELQLHVEKGNYSERWDIHIILPSAPPVTFLQADSYEHYFKTYADVPFLDSNQYDVILVRGQARGACLSKAVALLRPHGGILVLPNAQRTQYQDAINQVPGHWRKFNDVNAVGLQTLVWLSCSSEC